MTAREAALTALERCRRDGAWSSAAIDKLIRGGSLEGREAALASKLCLGVLQNSTYLDFYIDNYCSTASNKLQPKLRDILRIGTYQLLFLDRIPARAAVNEAVTMAKSCGFAKAAGLVNAVLRKIADNLNDLPEIPGIGSPKYLSVRYSHPLWLADRIIKQQTYSFTEKFLAANNEEPALYIQVNTLKTTVDEYCVLLEKAGISCERVSFPGNTLRLNGGSVTKLPGFDEGLFYVQDLAARTAVEAAGVEPGMKLLDACSAPGGKSFAAAIIMDNKGEILSCDIHDKKLSLIKSGADRLGIDIISTKARDARHDDVNMHSAFDIVIADVPCSGLGVIGKKPEIRQKSEKEIENLPVIQREILTNLASFVKPGGILLYSTCTVLREENEGVVKAFLAGNKNYQLVPFELGDIKAESGMYTFWPNIDNCDGFFAAKLRRSE